MTLDISSQSSLRGHLFLMGLRLGFSIEGLGWSVSLQTGYRAEGSLSRRNLAVRTRAVDSVHWGQMRIMERKMQATETKP